MSNKSNWSLDNYHTNVESATMYSLDLQIIKWTMRKVKLFEGKSNTSCCGGVFPSFFLSSSSTSFIFIFVFVFFLKESIDTANVYINICC